MIRNLMLGMSLVTLSAVSAVAAPVAHHAKAKVVAQAPAADAPAPSTDKPVKKTAKKAPKKDKGETKGEAKMGTKGEIAPAGEKAPVDAPKAK